MDLKFTPFKFLGLLTIIFIISFYLFYQEKKISNQIQISGLNKKVGDPHKKPQTWNQLCANCHSVGGEGGDIGPPLDLVGDKFTPENLVTWLRDPDKLKHGTLMPNLELSEAEMKEIVTFLSNLKGKSI